MTPVRASDCCFRRVSSSRKSGQPLIDAGDLARVGGVPAGQELFPLVGDVENLVFHVILQLVGNCGLLGLHRFHHAVMLLSYRGNRRPEPLPRDTLALLKANPGKYSYGSGGNGSSAHFTAELFKSMAGVDIAHIPYKGATPALTDVIGGQVVMFMGNLPPAMGHIKTGRVRALAVTTAQRSPLVPDIPTVAESGLPGFETVAWFGLFAPAGTPREIVVRIREEVAKIVQQPEIRERITTLGGEPVGNTPDTFATIVKSDIAKWRQVAKTANITAD